MSLIKRNQEKRKNSKILFKKIKKQVQGITLIALVVTVIVLLILAGVAINLTVGDNGLFRRAQNAADTWQMASEREAIELAVAGIQIGSGKETNMINTELENSLKEQFGDAASVEDNGDGSFLVTIVESQYYIGEDGKIIDSSNMIEISSAEELKAFRDDVNGGNTYEEKYVYLTNDINLNIDEGWEPIGLYPMESTGPTDESNNKPFKGIFDGNNHEINGINISTSNKGQGLFGIVNSGTIKNVTIGSENNFNVGNASAALVGYLYNSNIYNCINESDVNSTGSYIGGIAGFEVENSKVKNCYNKGDITTNEDGHAVGGIIGQSQDSIVFRCMNMGVIKSRKVGGISGYSSSTEIMECANLGSISSSTTFSGGISGEIRNTTIVACYNTGNVTVSEIWSGGISSAAHESCKIENCYNIGNITGPQKTSGICQATSGGKLEVNNCYYLENTVNEANDIDKIEGITPKTSEELKKLSETLGEAFKQDVNIINNGYPLLAWQ